ncbi:MAG: 5'-methylthioadenosine/S-adenosylhomocysteine nucleosidase [Gammaproteobacteria bacterium CG11_big_fil_rev_8_21_14_0_20_46_22]|nr:MAG: 5'-methylthioadenosine/S-adenosylhomocysteine nucleosidase [Gammaproteobacteria bacterium CG12_big_fil_rev_8_21_14_0_65_46_12]PIR10046.1 MAG: 5'-methylthioadenosine/S-adenosylhomocysteine nucleosidase [Gammaproteobacteria bacterium CG11_big_fil_rev_8_21_14_0_20_46_22]
MITGIMGAMPEEIELIRELMTETESVERGSRTYYKGKINGADAVLVFSRWGKVAASTTATSLIAEFKVDRLIFTGVAGAAAPELNIGDVVISSEAYQHDMDPRPLFPKHEVPLTGMTFLKACENLVAAAKSASEDLLARPGKELLEKLEHFNIKTPRCYLGVIASGDQFIADSERTAAILHEQPATLAVEMEGAAVAQVCHDYKIPFVVIRTISDRADHQAHIDFPAFIAGIARHYSQNIIKQMFV